MIDIGGTLHIYSPVWQHADAFIIGDRQSLENLRDSLDRVLSGEEATGFNAFVNDGEGYNVRVAMFNEQEMDRLAVPYTDTMERPVKGVWPHQAIHDQSLNLSLNQGNPLL